MCDGRIWAWLSEPEQEEHAVLTANTRCPLHNPPQTREDTDCLFFRAELCGCSTAS